MKSFVTGKPLWINSILTTPMIRREMETMEDEAHSFCHAAIAQTSDAGVRQLLGDLATEETKHYDLAETDGRAAESLWRAGEKEEESERRRFALQMMQPGLAGLMDGSVSTLAPVFAATFATHRSGMLSW